MSIPFPEPKKKKKKDRKGKMDGECSEIKKMQVIGKVHIHIPEIKKYGTH